MARPRAVKQAADNARKMAEQIMQDQQTQAESGERAGDEVVRQYLEEPPASRKTEESGAESEHGESETPTPPTHEAEPEPKPERDPGDTQPDSQLERIKSAYSVLQGKYNAEVPRLQRDLAEAKREIERLKSAKPADSGDVDFDDPAYKDLLQEYPEDLVKGIARIVKNASAGNKPEANTPQAEAPQQDQPDTKPDDGQDKTNLLAQFVPDWREIDISDGWKKWLMQVERMSGRTRQQLMMEAWTQGDVMRVAEFFDAYKAATGINQRKSPPRDTNVQPESRGSQTPPTERPEKRIWRISEVNDIEGRARRGEFKRQPEKLARLRQDIAQAAAENRIDMSK